MRPWPSAGLHRGAAEGACGRWRATTPRSASNQETPSRRGPAAECGRHAPRRPPEHHPPGAAGRRQPGPGREGNRYRSLVHRADPAHQPDRRAGPPRARPWTRATLVYGRAERLLRRPDRRAPRHHRDRDPGDPLGPRDSRRCTTRSTRAPPSSPPAPRTCTRPTTTRPRSRRATKPKVIILGSGPNRIGQGIEFDYACVHALVRARRGRLRDRDGQLQPRDGLHRLRHLGRLYFEPLTLEDVLKVVRAGAGHRNGRGRDRAARRPDPAGPGPGT